MTASLQLYRELLRAAARLPVLPIQRKVKVNIRQVCDLYKLEESPQEVAQLHKDGQAALVVIRWINSLAKGMPPQMPIYLVAGCQSAVASACSCMHVEANFMV